MFKIKLNKYSHFILTKLDNCLILYIDIVSN